MMTFLIVVIVLNLILLFLSQRILIGNKKTFEQRMELHNVVFDKTSKNWMYNYKPLLDSLNKVSYERHMWSLVFFRDPYKLYDENLLKALESYEES